MTVPVVTGLVLAGYLLTCFRSWRKFNELDDALRKPGRDTVSPRKDLQRLYRERFGTSAVEDSWERTGGCPSLKYCLGQSYGRGRLGLGARLAILSLVNHFRNIPI
jgi:hypothetical protein